MKKNVRLLPACFPEPGTSGTNILLPNLSRFNADSLNVPLKAALVSLIFFLSLTNLLAQPTIQWENTILGNSEEEFTMARQTKDGGYILGGSSISNAGLEKTENARSSDGDYWVVKLNAAGVQQWDKTLGGNSADFLTSVDPTADGGVIVAGTSGSTASGDKSDNTFGTWIVKLNAAGGKEWDKTIENAGTLIEQTPDGGYILSGGVIGRILKLNASGNFVWERNLGGEIQQTADEGFILIGPALAIKLNAAGVTQWQQPLEGTGNITYVRQTADGGYIMGGIPGEDYYVLKLNAAGKKEWEKTIGGLSTDWLRAIIQTADGGYILGGDSHSGAGGDKTELNKGPLYFGNNYYYTDYWIVKLDAAGNRVWDKTLGGIFHEKLRSLQQTADGGLIIGGQSDSNNNSYNNIPSNKSEFSGTVDYWVVKLSNINADPNNNLCKLALTSKVTQAEPWYGLYPGGGGGIDITVTGGTPPYNYTWDNFRNSPEDAPVPVVSPGVHTVLVTDAQGCTLRATIEVGKKNDPMRLSTTHTNVTTAGDPVGSIDLTVVGGTGPYKYLWSNGATSEDLTGLGVGTYTVTVTDAFGRKLTTSVTIVNPRTPTPVICNLVATSKVTQAESWYGMWGPTSGAGAIDVTPSGGTAPYTYKWNTGATTEDLAVAAPGVYTLTITDAKACTTTTTVIVSRKNGPLSLTESHTNVTTGGTTNGSIDLTVVGGTGPFRYRWSNGATTEDLTGLAAGTYSVIVTDAFNRTATISVQILGAGTTAIASVKSPDFSDLFTGKQTSINVYPNPAKDQTVISFTMPAAGKYALDLYDIRGAKVKSLATGQAPANKALNVEVPLNSIAEGIYLLKLQTDEGIATKRISIIR
ncbi:hypothetical protein AAE02nite_18060 [Adhaeribacter aerolatus]|uniref:Secretion system C-terminal sorting domain-containing protein n=1 Tax=Adhaeribacter aerolatus TaxID=670289 RepID=A0A512AWQ2_9BACT|nr:T9SS type A sorting domain-containing protein [Adhaeribacter aerolatus]GEO04142.1 hypothetical protein AAE02nite_18060 [Adhaeribacter aerolatus]